MIRNNNVFDHPLKYLTEIKSVRIPTNKRKRFLGKNFICVWLTKNCPVGCSNCFFKSDMHRDTLIPEQNELSSYGIEKLIRFINDSNNSYLQISGGGEPMIRKDAVLEIIKKTKTSRFVIITSGFWATSYEKAKKTIYELYEAHKSRNDEATLVLRLSIDEFHQKSLGVQVIVRIIEVYQKHFKSETNFELRLHTLDRDPILKEVVNIIDDCEISDSNTELSSDNREIMKITPKQSKLIFKDGYEIQVEEAKLFYSDLRVDLRTISPNVQKALDVFEKDISESEYGNPSIITNMTGQLGLDLRVDYNGNITAWGNQQLDQLFNIYTDDCQTIVSSMFDNVMSYSFLEKGFYYRESIIRDVNPKAVLRSKSINLRDYAGAFLLEEEKTRIYYGIRVVKDYLDEGVLNAEDIENLSIDLKKMILEETAVINIAYDASTYDMLEQYSKKTLFVQDEWLDLFLLIKLGHYDITEESLRKGFDYFNRLTGSNIKSLEDISISDDVSQYRRLHERISFMQPEAEKFCLESSKEMSCQK